MQARRLSTITLSLILALLAILPTRAQGPGSKGGPFIPGAPLPRSPAFRQAHGLRLAVERVLQGVGWGAVGAGEAVSRNVLGTGYHQVRGHPTGVNIEGKNCLGIEGACSL